MEISLIKQAVRCCRMVDYVIIVMFAFHYHADKLILSLCSYIITLYEFVQRRTFSPPVVKSNLSCNWSD